MHSTFQSGFVHMFSQVVGLLCWFRELLASANESVSAANRMGINTTYLVVCGVRVPSGASSVNCGLVVVESLLFR